MTNLANAQEHVPEAEHKNHILKEHIHATCHRIPYKMLPRTVICYMLMETAAKLNYFPAKGGCSNYFSPSEILHHVKLDYKKHCSMPLLSYVLAHDEPTLTNADTIYIKTQAFRLLRYYSPPRNIARSDWVTQNITHNMTSSIVQPYGPHSL